MVVKPPASDGDREWGSRPREGCAALARRGAVGQSGNAYFARERLDEVRLADLIAACEGLVASIAQPLV
jgi:hypothetical protein